MGFMSCSYWGIIMCDYNFVNAFDLSTSGYISNDLYYSIKYDIFVWVLAFEYHISQGS